MNLNISKRKNGRIYLYIEKGYRDKATKKSRSKLVKSLGYLDELEKQYPDPIAHFRELARKMTEEEEAEKRITLTINMDEQLPNNAEGKKNFGYAALLKIYHSLELHKFFNNKARHKNFEFNTNSIMILLVISRLLYPGSKKKAFEEKGLYFERFDFSLDDIYRALSHYAGISKELQRHMHEKITAKYGRDMKIIYFMWSYFLQNDCFIGDIGFYSA